MHIILTLLELDPSRNDYTAANTQVMASASWLVLQLDDVLEVRSLEQKLCTACAEDAFGEDCIFDENASRHVLATVAGY